MAENDTGASSQGGNKLGTILQVVQTLLIAAVLVFVVKGRAAEPRAAAPATGDAHASAASEPSAGGEHGADAAPAEHGGGHAAAGGPTLKVGDLIVQLRDPEVDRYAKMSFDLEVGSEEEKNAVSPSLPRVREALISYFSDRTPEELRGSEGLAKAKKDLLEKVRDIAGKRVKNIYISDFVAQ